MDGRVVPFPSGRCVLFPGECHEVRFEFGRLVSAGPGGSHLARRTVIFCEPFEMDRQRAIGVGHRELNGSAENSAMLVVSDFCVSARVAICPRDRAHNLSSLCNISDVASPTTEFYQ